MGKFLIKGNYVGDGVAGLLKEGGTSRTESARAAVESVGGSMDCLYFAFGDTDIWGIADIPDDASAAALSLTINASGAVAITLIPLLTAEDIDAASTRSPSYRPPGS